MQKEMPLDHLKELLEQDPCSGAIHLLAEMLYQLGQYPQAVETCRHGLILFPDHPELCFILARSLLALELPSDALAVLQPLFTKLRSLGEVLSILAEVYRQQGQELQAVRMRELHRLLMAEQPEEPMVEANLLAASPQHRLSAKTMQILEKWQQALKSYPKEDR